MASKKSPSVNSARTQALMQEAYDEASDLLETLKSFKIDDKPISQRAAFSLKNLQHYRLLRSADRKRLQEKLFLLGLSSLGRSFSHIEASVENILSFLSVASGSAPFDNAHALEAIDRARQIVDENRCALLGGCAGSTHEPMTTRVMVTLPSDAATPGNGLIRELADAGVDIFRINTAHDALPVYRAMAASIRGLDLNRPAEKRRRIYVDLCGPKIRTGPVAQTSQPIKVGSNKIERVVYLAGPGTKSQSQKKDAKTDTVTPGVISVEAAFLKACEVGMHIKAVGLFEKHGQLEVIAVAEDRVTCRLNTKLYLDEKCELKIKGDKHRSHVLNIAKAPEIIRLFKNDRLLILPTAELGQKAQVDKNGNLTACARIGCTHPAAYAAAKKGERVFIDDGKIGARVIDKTDEGLLCEVFSARESGVVLKPEKGINFPDTPLEIAALSDEDRQTLTDVADFADMIGLSFAQEPADIQTVDGLLRDLKKPDTGLVAKIETAKGVTHLPQILEALIQTGRPAGVMIARGDLAIEMGFENLAWLQEEILDICAAAHIPVIWATQVLENQMKTNLPSRAEVTDAAMGSRAECVMLNKGAFAVDTIRVLERILTSFRELFLKNRQLLGQNKLWPAP
ncbi:MAG: pyruvate kinase [Campylobacterales bacterium]